MNLNIEQSKKENLINLLKNNFDGILGITIAILIIGMFYAIVFTH